MVCEDVRRKGEGSCSERGDGVTKVTSKVV